MKKTTDGNVPSGTETEEWRVMSATIAWALWSSPERTEQDIEEGVTRDMWDSLAADYRARIRAVLRQIHREGVEFITGEVANPNERMPQEWWDKTARLAWLLWLRTRRQIMPADQAMEEFVWQSASESYRQYVRNAVRGLREKGIHIR